MTQRRNSVTQDRDTLARARPSLRKGCHVVTCDTHGVTHADRDSDTRPQGPVVTITPGSSVGEKSRAHAAELLKDPRFASIAAGLSREPFSDPHPNPQTLAADAERAELHRSAAAAAIARHQAGQFVDPVHLEWCRAIVATFKPLQRPLGTGAPA